MSNKPGDLKVWHVPQVPGKAFEVEVPDGDLRTANLVWNLLADYDNFQLEHNIKPDFSNAGGIVRWEEDGEGGFDWFDVDEYEIEEFQEMNEAMEESNGTDETNEG